MATTAQNFRPSGHVKAFLDLIYEIKFSKHVPLVMILLFALFAVWRTNHYVSTQLNLGWVISWSLALCIELAMFAAGAACVITMREAYMRELRDEDANRAKLGVRVSFVVLAVFTLALMILAGADGAMESGGNYAFILLMLLLQFGQSCMVLIFINTADLELRDKLREEFKAFQYQTIIDKANKCPYCGKELHAKNRKRHINSCHMKP